jgi:SAM-dependent methyltransferase
VTDCRKRLHVRDDLPVVDWGAGEYERTAAELEPVAELVVEMAALSPEERVIDLACGTGNAALLAAARAARVIGIDSAPRLLEVARQRAREQRLEVDFREGDLLRLPLGDRAADVVISVFGVIFASDPGAGLRELRRVARAGGRALITAWVPTGPIDGALSALNRILAGVAPEPTVKRFGWCEPDVLAPVAHEAGLELRLTRASKLAIRSTSVEAYLAGARLDPRAMASARLIERAGVQDEVQEAMGAVLREANEDPAAFLVHTPYVVHELAVV